MKKIKVKENVPVQAKIMNRPMQMMSKQPKEAPKTAFKAK